MSDAYQIIMPILLAIIAFWLVRFVISVEKLKILVASIRNELSGKNAACREKHINIDNRLNSHDKKFIDLTEKFEDHDKKIAVIESKIE